MKNYDHTPRMVVGVDPKDIFRVLLKTYSLPALLEAFSELAEKNPSLGGELVAEIIDEASVSIGDALVELQDDKSRKP